RVRTAEVLWGPARQTSLHVRRELTQWASIALATAEALDRRSALPVNSASSRALNATRALNPDEPTSKPGFAHAAPSLRRIDRTSSRFLAFQRRSLNGGACSPSQRGLSSQPVSHGWTTRMRPESGSRRCLR